MPKEIPFVDLQFIIEFVYRGEIDVSEAELQVSKFYIYILHVHFKHNCVDLEVSLRVCVILTLTHMCGAI